MINNLILPILMFVLLVLSRMMSDIPNFTATISLIVFTGYLIHNKLLTTFIILISQVISDLYIGIYASMFFVYSAYVLIGLVSPIIMNKINIRSVFLASLVSPSIFFIVSNFGVWVAGSLYPLTMAGLISCYIAGIPFFDESLVSTIIFSFTFNFMMKLKIKNPEELILVKK